MTTEQLASIAGIVLSLLFSYIPGLNVWFGLLDPLYKRLIMAGLLILVAAASFGLSCYGLWPTVECSQAGALGLIEILVAALIANQAAFLLSPQAPAVEQAKKEREGLTGLALGRG